MPLTNLPVSESRVRFDNASVPISKFLYRLSLPLRAWKKSSYARVAELIRRLPHRILAMNRLNTILRGQGYTLPAPVEAIPYLAVLSACKTDIEGLRNENPWMTSLDLEMASAGWTKGLLFGLCNRTEKESEFRRS
jgi:hypothetical protein